MTAPDFLVIGAQIAGANWVHDCLKQHPAVFMPKRTDVPLFAKPDYDDPALRAAYLAQFDGAGAATRVGETTTGYFWTTDRSRAADQPPKSHNPDVPAAVADVLGDRVDFIVALRHPVWRAIAAFGNHVKRGRIAAGTNIRDVAHTLGILDIGLYGAHLDIWTQAVGANRLEVVILEDDILPAPQEGYAKLCRFLGIADDFVPKALTTPPEKNMGYKMTPEGIVVEGIAQPITPEDIAFLIAAYAPDIARTKTILGRDLATWDAETERLEAWLTTLRSPSFKAPKQTNPAVKLGIALLEHGVQAGVHATAALENHSIFEPPVRLGNLRLEGLCHIGAFTQATSGRVLHCRIGRYCSIGEGAQIGQPAALSGWLSTHAFQHDPAFAFASGPLFPDRTAFEAALPDPKLTAKARRAAHPVTTLGHDVHIGAGAVIVAGVTIGDGAVIAPRAVVSKDVAPFEVVDAVRATQPRYRFDAKQRARLAEGAWWQYASWQLDGVPFDDVDAALTEIAHRAERNGMAPYRPTEVVFTQEGLKTQASTGLRN